MSLAEAQWGYCKHCRTYVECTTDDAGVVTKLPHGTGRYTPMTACAEVLRLPDTPPEGDEISAYARNYRIVNDYAKHANDSDRCYE